MREWNGPGWASGGPHDDSNDRHAAAVPTELARGRGGGGPAPTRIVVAYGFWIFILSDIVMFSGLFAAYAVLSGNTAGGPTGRELFNLRNVFIETMCLLFSSYTCGLGALSAERRQPGRFLIFAALTFVLGAAFLFIEISEFAGMVSKGAGPSRSAFLSGLLHLGRHARRARHQRPDLAHLYGGAGRRQGLAARTCCGACCAAACSGTRWTSSGSGCSRWSI